MQNWGLVNTILNKRNSTGPEVLQDEKKGEVKKTSRGEKIFPVKEVAHEVGGDFPGARVWGDTTASK